MVEEVLEAAEPAARKLSKFDGKIRLIGQYDADGICATAIAHEMLSRLGKDFEYEILKQLYEEDVERIAEEDEELLLFVDIGSGQSEKIRELIVEDTDKEVIVSDHHDPQIEDEPKNPESSSGSGKSEGFSSFIHLNPHFLGHDGGEAISAAGMTYLLSEAIDEDNIDLVQYALVGATGDVQKQEGEFLGLNQELLRRAEENGLIDKRQGLDLYGRTTKPLHKSLMYTSDPPLPGVTNSESGAIQLVKSAGIDLRENGDFRCLSDLSAEEEKKLIHQMIKQGFEVEPLLRNVYMLENGHGIDEFSTIINACGRLGEPKKGVKILLKDDLELAEKIQKRYSRKISSALSFVEENRDNENVVYQDTVGVIDAGSSIGEDFIGTVTTISMSNGFFKDVPAIIGAAEAEKGKLKISSRATKEAVENGLNLGEVVEEAATSVDGEGGGHNVAAGAKIPESEKQRFLKELKQEIRGAA